MLEMDGFKDTFKELYIINGSEDGSGSGYSILNEMLIKNSFQQHVVQEMELNQPS